MFGSIGMPELIIIFVIALIIFGPRKLPELGRSLGQSLNEFKRASNELRNTLDEEIRIEESRSAERQRAPEPVRPFSARRDGRAPSARRGITRAMALVPFPGGPRRFPTTTTIRHIHLTDPDALEDAGAKMSFLDHLDELRKRLIACIYALVFGCAGRLLLRRSHPGLHLAAALPRAERRQRREIHVHAGLRALHADHEDRRARRPDDRAAVHPLSAVAVHRARAVHARKEDGDSVRASSARCSSSIGAAFSHYVAFPWTWKFFLGWETEYMEFRPTIADTFGLYVKMLLGFGLIFQMPTIVYFLARMGVVYGRVPRSSTPSTPSSRSSSSRRSSAPAPTSSRSA